MTRNRFFTLVAVFSIAACSDNPNSAITGPIDPRNPQQPILPAPSSATISGRISVSGYGDRAVELRDAGGNVYRLVGGEAARLASVDGADVVARGTFDANPGFVVEEFQVTGMFGRPALDGVLEATDDGYALRLTDGSLRVVPGLTNCSQHVGARLWVIGWDEESGPQFGLIAAV
jgi:hypothetical protein